MTASLVLAVFFVFRIYYFNVYLDQFVLRIYLLNWDLVLMPIWPDDSCCMFLMVTEGLV
ncbi:MAG: hypothetical protein RL001_29 [Pseudomonadota bacterium]|jgi:hypothetical protein